MTTANKPEAVKKPAAPRKTAAAKTPRAKKPTLKEKVAAAEAPNTARMTEDTPDVMAVTAVLAKPRLSGRAYAALRHAEVLARPGIVSKTAPAHRVKGRSRNGWTNVKPK